MTSSKKCPKCGNSIASDSFEFHLEHGHDIGGEYDVDDYDWDDDGINDVDFLQPNIDASKNIGYPCREEGAYGSYPSMDGFDDESDA